MALEGTDAGARQDKSMARLAEILREKGVEVWGFEEGECCQPPKLHFTGSPIPLRDLEDMVEDSGYQVARIHDITYEYEQERTGLPWVYSTFEFVVSPSQ